MDLGQYRSLETEKFRLEDLLRLLPTARRSILEIGARDGYHSRILTAHFESVTALDLTPPRFSAAGVIHVQGDVTALPFPDDSFDCVLCAEVLEHVPDVNKAASEIGRVAKHEVVVGVPYRQDTRVGKLTCQACLRINPPYGHINTFNESRLRRMFQGLQLTETSFVGSTTERTNAISSWLMTLAGNPWGTYGQEEGCIYCGEALIAPVSRTLAQKVTARLAHQLEQLQGFFVRPHPSWIHALFCKAAARTPGGPAGPA